MAGETTTNGLAGIRPTKGNPDVIDQVHENAVAESFPHWQDGTGFAAVVQGRVTSTTAATAVANGATEADAQSASEITTTVATYTSAIKAVFVIVSMASQMTTPVDLKALSARTIGIALANKLDSDITALFSGFSNVVGDSGVAMAIQTLLAASLALRVNAQNRSADAVFCLHPRQISDVQNAAINSNSPFVPRVLAEFDGQFGAGRFGAAAGGGNYHGMFDGFPVFSTTLVGTVNVGADRGGALLVVPSMAGVGAAIGGSMISIGRGGQDDGTMLPQQRLADAMSGWSMYAVGEEMDVFGVLCQSDA